MVPKYTQLKEHLMQRIREGDIGFGEQLPSENELAREFKLSRHTVRQTFGELETEGWIRREQGRGTFCSYDKCRRQGAGKTIALVTTYISEYIFPGIIRGVEEVVSAAGFQLALANTNNDKTKEGVHLNAFLHQGIAGLIVEPTKSSKVNTNFKFFKEFEQRGIPYLFFHAVYPDLDPAYIMMDDFKGGYLVGNYLLQQGHREIAGIFKSDDRQGVNRRAGFEKALSEYGLTLSSDYLGLYETEQADSFPDQFINELVHAKIRPTALFAYNDQIALKTMAAIREAGLTIPGDISVVGYDDSPLAKVAEVKLTTVRHPQAALGRRAARFIIDMIEKNITRPRFIYQPELIVRESCRTLKRVDLIR